MKAVFNEKRKIIAIGENIWNSENRNDWCEITGGDTIDSKNLWAMEYLYTIDKTGIVTRDPLADYKIKMAKIREQRTAFLLQCDWTQLPDSSLPIEVKVNWVLYRQSLRDLPNQDNFDPDNFSWPEKP